MTSQNDKSSHDELQEALGAVRRRLSALTTVVMVLALAVALCAAAVYGEVANYFGSNAMLQVLVAIVAAALGFTFGWFARRMVG